MRPGHTGTDELDLYLCSALSSVHTAEALWDGRLDQQPAAHARGPRRSAQQVQNRYPNTQGLDNPACLKLFRCGS